MPAKNRHIALLLLLTNYLFVGTAARFEALGMLFGIGSGPQQIADNKPTPPTPARACWIQQKHLPSFTKISLISHAVVHSPEFPRFERYGGVVFHHGTPTPFRYHTSTISSRAPPLTYLSS